MSRLLDSLGHETAKTEIARNAVLEQQRRLAAEFAASRTDQTSSPGATGPFAGMLCEVLVSAGWEGKQHQISRRCRI